MPTLRKRTGRRNNEQELPLSSLDHSYNSRSSSLSSLSRFLSVDTNRSKSSNSFIPIDLSQNSRYPHYTASTNMKPRSKADNLFRLVMNVLFITLPWLYPTYVHWQIHSTRSAIINTTNAANRLQRDVRWQTQHLHSLREESIMLVQEQSRMMEDLKRAGDTISLETEEYALAHEIESLYLKRVDELKSVLKAMGIRFLKQMADNSRKRQRPLQNTSNFPDFTIPPVLVEVVLSDNLGTFVISLDPRADAPYAMSHFVRLVQANLFDGLTLIHKQSLRADNLIHSVPMVHVSHTFDDARFERRMGRSELAFIEDHQAQPSEEGKYTVSFAGHGPHFYIHMGPISSQRRKDQVSVDNTIAKEVTFGTVVEGREVVDQIMESHSETGMLMVGIETARML